MFLLNFSAKCGKIKARLKLPNIELTKQLSGMSIIKLVAINMKNTVIKKYAEALKNNLEGVILNMKGLVSKKPNKNNSLQNGGCGALNGKLSFALFRSKQALSLPFKAPHVN